MFGRNRVIETSEGEDAAADSKTQDAGDATIGTGLEVSRHLGRGLIEAAQEQNRIAVQSAAIGKVQELMVMLRKQRDYRQNCDENIALLERKLKAVDAGEITLSPYGVITFTDPALQKGVVAMAECTNCGYSRKRSDPRD